jgi:predicted permease
LSGLLQDLRFGARLVRRNLGFSIVIVSVLGIGIGAVATVISVANSLLLRPPALEDPSSLVRVFSGRFSGTPLLDLMAYDDGSTTLSGIAAFREARLSLRIGDGAATPLFGTFVTRNYFDVAGVAALRGRTFLPNEGRAPGTSPVAVLSYRSWQRLFGGDTSVVGTAVWVNGQSVTLIGVMPESFVGMWGPVTADLWLPVAMHPVFFPGARTFEDREAFYAQAVARLRPGVALAEAQAEVDTRHGRWRASPSSAIAERSSLRLYPMQFLVPEMRANVAVFLGILGGLVASLLGIVCVNVANLMLAKNSARGGEFGVRLAVGASRGRLVRQLLTESAGLAAMGALVGICVAFLLTRALGLWTPPAPVPIVVDVTPDARVLMAVCAVGALATLVFGLAPTWTTSRGVTSTLGQVAARGTAAGRTRLRAALLIAQVSLSLLLMGVAGLLIRSLSNAERIDLGFEPDGVLLMSLDLDASGYTPSRGRHLHTELLASVRALPGVRAASLLDVVPLTGSSRGSEMLKEGAPAPSQGRSDSLVTVGRTSVAEGHFAALRIPFLLGRDFTSADTESGPPVAIVNETLARTFWPGETPIGRRLRLFDREDPASPLIEVVGLVRDSKYISVGEAPRPFMYRPLSQEYSAEAALVVRVDGDPLAFASAVHARLQALDASLPVFEMRTLSDATSLSLLPIRLAASVVTALAIVVLGLAAMGIYGVLSFVVRQRTREIGILMALGAEPGRIVVSVLREALVWIGWGSAAGLVLALAAAPMASSLLYGVDPHDLPSLLTVTAVLLLVGAAAALGPALRASRLSPAEALRREG